VWKKYVQESARFMRNVFILKIPISHMIPTQKADDEMDCDRGNLLCRVLEAGGKCLDNDSLAFQKKQQFCEQ
jgi:hypothetical protein